MKEKVKDQRRAAKGERAYFLTAIGLFWLASGRYQSAQETRMVLRNSFKNAPIQEVRDYYFENCAPLKSKGGNP